MDNLQTDILFDHQLKLLFEDGENRDDFQEKLTDFFPAIIYVYDADKNKLRYINKKITDLLGYEFDEIKSWNSDLMKMVFTEDIDLVKKELKKFYDLKDDESHFYQSRLNHKKGDWKYFKTFGTILRRNENGKAASMLFIAQEYEPELEKKLKDLDRSNKELEEFAYIASHDLQEPLRKISTFAERLQIKFENELGEEGRQYLIRMNSATKNMRLLIENLLEFSRATLKNKSFIKTDLNVIVSEVQTELELQIEETKTVINSDKLPEIEIIPSQIKQLFANIFSNAIKFRKPSENVLIEIKCKKLLNTDKQSYQLEKNNEYYKISISDNGIGFEPEYNEKILQIFQRLHGKSKYPGSGIGLAICKKVVDNHNGLLFAFGEPESGATFTIILPEKNNIN
ncbi:MAG: sensor histidine kinase [Chitinophagaceae bacterium]